MAWNHTGEWPNLALLLEVGELIRELLVAGCFRRVCRARLARAFARKEREGEVGLKGRGHLVNVGRALDGALGLRGGREGSLLGVDVEASESRKGIRK